VTSTRADDGAGLPSWRRLARTLKANPLAPPQRCSAPWRFASAPAATLLVALVQYLAFPDPAIAPFVFMYVAPVLAAWFGGRLPGLLAVARRPRRITPSSDTDLNAGAGRPPVRS
jgi:hypothetical protein